MEQTTQNTPASPQADTPAVQSETPAEVVYQPEGSLPPITSLDDLSHIRAIDKQGRSVTMTPAQLRELTGIDYSKLEEQIVPGEKWLSSAEQVKQVYVKTLYGRLPIATEIGSMFATLLPANYADEYEIVRGSTISIDAGENSHRHDSYLPYNSTALSSATWSVSRYSDGRILLHASSTAFSGAYYSVSLKYTKK